MWSTGLGLQASIVWLTGLVAPQPMGSSHFSSVQFSHSFVSDSLQPHELQQARPLLSITNSRSLPKLISIESVMPSIHLILCRPLLLLPSIFPSIRIFSDESVLHIRWPKYWSFSFNISPSNEHPGLIFRMDRLDLLAVQGTLKSLLVHHSSKASILQCSAFFIVQLSHPHLTTGKTGMTQSLLTAVPQALFAWTLSSFGFIFVFVGWFFSDHCL